MVKFLNFENNAISHKKVSVEYSDSFSPSEPPSPVFDTCPHVRATNFALVGFSGDWLKKVTNLNLYGLLGSYFETRNFNSVFDSTIINCKTSSTDLHVLFVLLITKVLKSFHSSYPSTFSLKI